MSIFYINKNLSSIKNYFANFYIFVTVTIEQKSIHNSVGYTMNSAPLLLTWLLSWPFLFCVPRKHTLESGALESRSKIAL